MISNNNGEKSENDRFFDGEHLARQFRKFQLLFVAVKAGIPVALAEQPRTLTELSDRLGLAAPRLHRVLRGLIWWHVLETNADGSYLLTTAGEALLDERPHSLASNIRFQGEFFFNAWGHLWDYLESGETPFKCAYHGSSLFEILEASEPLAALFSAPMTAHSATYSRQIAAHPAFIALNALFGEEGNSALIVDVGGGEGRLLVDILKTYPNTHGILLELPVIEAAAKDLLAREDLSDRCRFVKGDMFTAVPENGDIYLLKWVIHDWNDADAVRILQRCAEAMRPAGVRNRDEHYPRLIVVERLMPDVVNATNTGLVQADLNMLCLMGGAERTLVEYEGLLDRAGLRLLSSRPLGDIHGFVALECILVETGSHTAAELKTSDCAVQA